MKTLTWLFVSVLLVSLACAQPAPGYLNVRDLGATGSQFQTGAKLTAGSKQITVEKPGDFQVGQGVMISRANIQIIRPTLWGPAAQRGPAKPVGETMEIRGYDGSLGSWTVYIIDIPPGKPATFRWSDDLTRTWKQEKVPITGDWQKLSGGTEIKFGKNDWESGYVVTFSARDQLLTSIEKIEGNTITLKEAPTRDATDAVIRHNDTEALQKAIDQAIAEKRNVYFPPGFYRLSRGLEVKNATGITIEGANGVDSILDISEGEGACFELRDGTEVNIRNFRMLGHTGFDARDQAGSLRLQGAQAVWGFYLKPCYGMKMSNTERVLLENCHASKMSGECFYSGGRARSGTKPEPKQYTKSITYLRCSVTDSARNAFNNNDMAENTSVLNCRIVDVGGCTWEGASRFVKFTGNYVRNAGTVAMGNIRSRDEAFEILGSGQHIIADNTFEGNICYGGAAIRAASGSTQVVVRDNLFVNFNSSCVDISGVNSNRDLTAGIATISGNIFDMTDVSGTPKARIAVDVSGSDVIVCDNQMYVRGAVDPAVTAVRLREPAVNLSVHDNLIRNCGGGLITERAQSIVNEVVSPTEFTAAGRVPLERRQSHRYRGWNVAFMRGGAVVGRGVIEAFDPEKVQFKLTKPADLKVGDAIEVFPATGNNWDLHHNTVVSCAKPIVLDCYGSLTAVCRDNTLTRGEATGVTEAITLKGNVDLLGNHFSGFNEDKAAAVSLYPDRFGKPVAVRVQDNIFESCGNPIAETQKGLWDACRASGNLFLGCPTQPVQKPQPEQTVTPVLRKLEAADKSSLPAPKLTKPVNVDGLVTEWPWADAARVGTIAQTPDGAPSMSPKSKLMAAHDAQFLYIAMRVTLPPNYKVTPSGGSYREDGHELAFQSADPAVPSPIFVLWGGAGGKFALVPVGGADAKQSEQLEKGTQYAAQVAKDEWTCEWKLPLSVIGPKFAQVKKLAFNVGIRYHSGDAWVAWVGTGAQIFCVDRAGTLQLQ